MSSERSSYTLANALRFKPAFDEALKTGNDINIPLNKSGYSLGTLKHRAAEALLFMCRAFDPELIPSEYKAEDYQRLRGIIKISFIPPEENNPGIVLKHKNKNVNAVNFNVLPQAVTEAKAAIESKKWKDQVMNFITGEGLVLNLMNLHLDVVDQGWAKEQLSKAGLEHIVNDKMIRATK